MTTLPHAMTHADYDDEGNLDVEWYPIPPGLMEDDELSKAVKPPSGYTPIPGGKRGGFRKRKASGKGYLYWYPDKDVPAKPALADAEKRRLVLRIPMERDHSKSPADLKSGAFVEVEGRPGQRFMYIPGHRKAGEGRTWVQSMSTGKASIVGIQSLVALKKRPKRKKPPPPPPPPKKKQPKGESTQPPDWPKPEDKPPPPSTRKRKKKMAKPWKGSTAPKGSALERVENGSLTLRQFKGKHDKRLRWTIEVPADIANQLASELNGVFHQAARLVAKNQRPPIPVVVPGTNELSEDYKELVAGARLGFVLSLRDYAGGRPFIPHVQGEARSYALKAAREMRAGAPLRERDMRVITGYSIAKQRAWQAITQRTGREATTDEIIKYWQVRKRQVFTGRLARLGAYTKRVTTKEGESVEKLVEQGDEELPDGRWRTKDPAGSERGQEYPGKRQIAAVMERLLEGHDVANDEWLSKPPEGLLPDHDDLAMPAGTALHVRNEILGILAKLKHPHGDALALRFGLYIPEDEDPPSLRVKTKKELRAMAKDRGLGLKAKDTKEAIVVKILDWAQTQDRPGTGGRMASANAVGDTLNIGTDLDEKSQAAKVRRIYKEGFERFLTLSRGKGASPNVRELVRHWGKNIDDVGRPEPGRKHGPMLPSDTYLTNRFKTPERVAIYMAGIRAGNASRVAADLDLEVRGELTPTESNKLRADYHAQLRADRQAAFNRYQAVQVDPENARDIGPHTGTPGEAEWLYSDHVLTGYMRAMIRGGRGVITDLPLTIKE